MRILDASDHSVEVCFGESIAVEHHQEGRSHHALAARARFGRIHGDSQHTPGLLVCPRELRSATRQSCRNQGVDSDVYWRPEAPPLRSPDRDPGLLRRRVRAGPCLRRPVERPHLRDVVDIHSSAEYLVFFLGFCPGFPYLGGLPASIATPRLDVPRTLVPAGSVAIAGNQAGIYPVASPGGWRIIGRTPLGLFRADREPPALLAMGDRVRFVERAPADPRRIARLLTTVQDLGRSRIRAPGRFGVGRGGRAGAAHGQPAGGEPRERRGAGDDADGRRV